MRYRRFLQKFYRQRDFREERLSDSRTVPKGVNEFVPVRLYLSHCLISVCQNAV